MQLSRLTAKAEPPSGRSIGNGGKVIGKWNASEQYIGQSQPMAVRSRAYEESGKPFRYAVPTGQ